MGHTRTHTHARALLVTLFLTPSLRVRAGGSCAALQAQASSPAFHTRSAVKTRERPHTPRPTAPSHPRLFCWANYEYSSRHESNAVRHATVRPHSVSSAVCSVWGETLTKTSPSLSFVIRLNLTVRWPKYNILVISFVLLFFVCLNNLDAACSCRAPCSCHRQWSWDFPSAANTLLLLLCMGNSQSWSHVCIFNECMYLGHLSLQISSHRSSDMCEDTLNAILVLQAPRLTPETRWSPPFCFFSP